MVHKPINRVLYDKTRVFIICALDLLIPYLRKDLRKDKSGFRYLKFDLEHKFLPDGNLDVIEVPYPDYSEFINKYREKLEEVPEYRTCSQVMYTDPIISKHIDCPVGTWGHRITPTVRGYLSDFLQNQLSRYRKKTEFSPEFFDRTYYDWICIHHLATSTVFRYFF